jgi:hypothetical protein
MDDISPSKRYYLKNRERILEREKEKKRWLTYHETHRDVVNARRREAYKAKKAAAAALVVLWAEALAPPASSPIPEPSSPASSSPV